MPAIACSRWTWPGGGHGGTLAELVGGGALAGDVQLRTFGLRRTAERTFAVLAPETQEALRAAAGEGRGLRDVAGQAGGLAVGRA
jgi:hypothetical protein